MTEAKAQEELSEADKKKLQKELQRQFNMFKKRFKTYSKSELIALIWEQGFEFRKIQDMAQELYEHNQRLLGIEKKEPENEEIIKDPS